MTEVNISTYSSIHFINSHVGLLYADEHDRLVDEWSKLADTEFAYNLANYVFSGADNVQWEQSANGDIIVRPA